MHLPEERGVAWVVFYILQQRVAFHLGEPRVVLGVARSSHSKARSVSPREAYTSAIWKAIPE